MQEIQTHLCKGNWKEGQRLPSIRKLAEEYQCSKSTIIRAYEELERRHLIYAVPQSGYFVVKRAQPTETQSEQIIDFASTVPDVSLFPYQDFQHCLNQAIDKYQNELFTYGTPRGLPSLIQVLQKQFADYQIFAQAERFVITSGVQQGLSILSCMPFPHGKETILVEQPSYHLFIRTLELMGKSVIGIERTMDGLDLNKVEYLFRTKPIKFFYFIPRFHNPLGTSLSKDEKKSLAELAKRYQVYLVEDDYLVDLEIDLKADPLYANQQDYVIYLKSFSKILFPGLRVGAVVLPEELIETFRQYKVKQDIDSSMLSQAGLEIYIKNGMFQYHREKMRTEYTTRIKKMYEVLKASEIDEYVSYPPVQSGLHTHLLLKHPFSINKLLERLKKQHILLGTGAQNFLTDYPQQNFLRLSVSNVSNEQIDEGISVILFEIKRLSKLYKRQFF